jgi:hypothetical protein
MESTPQSSLPSRHGDILAEIGDGYMSENSSSPEMDRFRDGLRQVLSVSKADLNRMLAEEKAAKVGKVKPGPKPKTSAHVSDETD